MDLQHKINKVNMLYDEIDRIELDYDFYEDMKVSDLVKIIRMHNIARKMTILLIKKGTWS